ncbi:hypothetical protein EC973_007744 [Apophysomyces ossiformis]|uniref:CAP-Gly domain-containing protein n=1 Tax=Apophysomyces ossiformis TaxID=679940 RepID=A0A8H7BXM7_9FUNG|nr:hypothetical protein EC973_007744 [Apophysomyces ossiformis]
MSANYRDAQSYEASDVLAIPPITPPFPSRTELENRLKSIEADDMALLLALETQVRADMKEAQATTIHTTAATRRQSCITFSLPAAPSRPKSHALRRLSLADPKLTQKNTRWAQWITRETTSQPPLEGSKVCLIRRPLPTFGTVRFIGTVDFAEGEWIGVELESRGKISI